MGQDAFGIRKLFEDKTAGSSFYMDVTNVGDPSININGSVDPTVTLWNCKPNMGLSPPSFRFHVFPPGDNIMTVATPDHSLAQSQGFMASAADFRNVEFTVYFKIQGYLKSVNLDEDYASVYFRGGVKHTADFGCSGCGYRSGIEYDGGWHATKYYAYPSNYYINPEKNFKFFNPRPTTNLLNRWIGMKVLCYDVPKVGQTSFTPETADVKLECYYDWVGSGSEPPVATNNWTKYFEIYDRGANTMGHTGDVTNCHAQNIYEILRWGGPLVTLRMDNVSSVQLKWLSVREIDIAAVVDSGTNPPVIPPEVLVYNLYPAPNNDVGVKWTRLGVVWNDAYDVIDKCFGGPGPGAPVGGQGPDIPNCDSGFHYDPVMKECVPDDVGSGVDGTGTPGGGGSVPTGTGKVYDSFGVQKLYPDNPSGTQWYMDMANPYSDGRFNVSYGTGSHYPINPGSDSTGLKYWNTRGEKVTYASGAPSGRSQRLDCYPDGGKWADKTNYSWKSNPGYLYTEKGIRNGEFTTFVRGRQDLGSNIHHAWAHKLAGRDEDSIRSVIEMVRPTVSHSDVQVNYNYAHFPYVNVTPTKVSASWPPVAQVDHWYGMKTVRKVAADMKSSVIEAWFDDDPFDATTGKPKNNWYLGATYNDHGVSGYNNIPCTWKCQKDLIRVDGWDSCDFCFFSDREIDPTATPGTWDAGAGTPGGVVNPPPSTRAMLNKIPVAWVSGQADTSAASAGIYAKYLTHELIESCTDADPGSKPAWVDTSVQANLDELGDGCVIAGVVSTYGSAPDDLPAEGYYSNQDGGCSIPGLVQQTGGSTHRFTDGGGPVIQNCKVYLIYWGATWNSDSALANLRSMIDHKVKDLLLGTYANYFSKLTQYSSVNAPTWGASVVDAVQSLPANGIQFSSIGSFVKTCISNGLVPKPDSLGWQAWYCVILKPGRYETTAPNTAAHWSFTYP